MIIQQPSETVRTMRTFGKAQHKCDYAADTSDVPEPIRRPPPEANDGIKTTSPRALHKARSAMSLPPESLTQWQRRQRIRPKRHPSPKVQFSEPPLIGGSDAAVLGPFDGEAGLADSTRSLKHFACPQQKLQQPVTVAVTFSDNKLHRESLVGSSIGFPNAGSRAESVLQPAAALLCPPFPPTAGIAIRHEFVLEMSKKSKRLGRVAGGGADIMDSLVSSIDEIASTPMRSPLTTNGHHRHRSDEYESVIMVSPAPVIQTSKSSTRSPGHNKLSRRPSVRNSVRDSARLSLRTSNSQEHWLPPIEQEDDFLSGTSLAQRQSYSSSPSSNSARHPHPSIPTRTTSITLDTPQIHIPQRSNSLMHTIAPPLPSPRSGHSRRSDHGGDIPSYIHRYLHKSHSKENLDTLDSPRRSTYSSRQLPPRSRNSTTAIPGNDHMRLGKLSKRSSTQGFERDLAATRHYYSLPPPPHNQSRHSASLKPSRDSLASDGSSFSRVNSNYVQEVLNNPKLTQRIRLTSGRILSFSEVGDKNGWPVFCFTGMGLNRLVAAFYDEVATSFGLRIITPDRPGIGLSEEIRPSPKKVLAWADDITEICQALSITHFSLLGHSLGATYALAVALRLPEKIRGQVHLLAPWIPLSQVTAATAMFDDISMDSSCMSFPATHRFLRVLPVPIIKVAGSFLREKEYDGKSNGMTSPRETKRSSSIPARRNTMSSVNGDNNEDPFTPDSPNSMVPENDLVAGIWAAATRDSNATIDLLTSLERPYTVGFTYFDVTLPVIIRHGSKDERVPLERVMWMTKAMNMARQDNAELKVIQGAQHGLMARADVMSDVFEEIARESHRWDGCIRCRKGGGCWLASNIKDAPAVPGKDRLRL